MAFTGVLHPAQRHRSLHPCGEANFKKRDEMRKQTASKKDAAQNFGEAGATRPFDAQRVTGLRGSLPPRGAKVLRQGLGREEKFEFVDRP